MDERTSRKTDNRSSEEIRRDIEGTRADLHETVDALERKLSVGEIVDELWGRMKGGSDSSPASAVGDVIRDHPVPLAMMGTAVAWMAVERATRSEGDRLRSQYGEEGPGTHSRAEGRRGPYRGDELGNGASSDDDSMMERAKDMAESAKAKAGDAKARAGDAKAKVSNATDRLGSKASDGADTVKSQTSSAAHAVKSTARDAKRGFRSLMEDQPLAIGAIAFGLGLAGGLAAPTTRWEDETMGDAADAVKDSAKDAVTDAADSARDVAADTAAAVKDEAERQGVVDDLEQSAKQIADRATETARRRAAEEDLDAEGMKTRGEEAKDEVNERARTGASSEGRQERSRRTD